MPRCWSSTIFWSNCRIMVFSPIGTSSAPSFSEEEINRGWGASVISWFGLPLEQLNDKKTIYSHNVHRLFALNNQSSFYRVLFYFLKPDIVYRDIQHASSAFCCHSKILINILHIWKSTTTCSVTISKVC